MGRASRRFGHAGAGQVVPRRRFGRVWQLEVGMGVHEETGEGWDVVARAKYPAFELCTIREYGTLFWDQFPAWEPDLSDRLPNSYGIVARRPEVSRANRSSERARA